jgi:hypothetical protein
VAVKIYHRKKRAPWGVKNEVGTSSMSIKCMTAWLLQKLHFVTTVAAKMFLQLFVALPAVCRPLDNPWYRFLQGLVYE